MRGWGAGVVLVVLLAACSGSHRFSPGEQPDEREPAELPPRAPRWLAVQLGEALYALRFDDPSEPSLTLLASPERGGTVDLSTVVWSPSGELEGDPQAHRFADRWSQTSEVLWAVDGTAILATTQAGLFFVPDPTAPAGFKLAEEAPRYIFAPDRWPQNDS